MLAISVKGNDPLLVLHQKMGDIRKISINDIMPRSPDDKISRWKSRFLRDTIYSIDRVIVNSIGDTSNVIRTILSTDQKKLTVNLHPVEFINTKMDKPLPSIAFNQISKES